MKPVNGTDGNSQKQPGNTNKKDSKREADKSRKTRRDIDSSDGDTAEENLGEGGERAPKMNSKQLSRNRDNEVRVAPNSTTYSSPSSTEPRVRPSSKREASQGKVKREQKIGKQHPHRRDETDLKENHPELKSLKSTERKKELVDRSKAAGGYLKVEIKDKKDVDMLVAILSENPSIHSLKPVCNFGGESGDPYSFSRNFIYGNLHYRDSHENSKHLKEPDFPDHESLEHILNACKSVDTLDVKGCRLSDESWKVLADKLLDRSSFVRLELGGGDKISQPVSEKIYHALTSGHSSLREFVIDDLSMDYCTFAKLVDGVGNHGKLSVVKLENIHYQSLFTKNSLTIDALFNLCALNPNLQYLSLAGTQFRIFAPANDDINFSFLLGMGPSADALAFNAHACLRVLDLTNCGLNMGDMSEIATAAAGHAALIDLRTEGNNISIDDRSILSILERRNRELLQKQASAALELLADHAAHQIETWPRELSEVLAQKASPMLLDALASLIGEGPLSQSGKRGSIILKPSEPGS